MALKAGDRHYRAYVGPPERYDLISGITFTLLTGLLGLREHHRLLDIGCGSLRNGRLLIPYLAPANYFGVEPERWLVDEGIAHECGQDQIAIKKPTFLYANDWSFDTLGVTFDYILAQSIFSHASARDIRRCLTNCASCMHEQSLMAATLMPGDRDYDGEEWVYPGVVRYTDKTIAAMADAAGLVAIRSRYFHPKLTWYLFALPQRAQQLARTADAIDRCADDMFGFRVVV